MQHMYWQIHERTTIATCVVANPCTTIATLFTIPVTDD